MPIRVDPSSIHGSGVFATRDLAASEPVGVYAGRRFEAGALPDIDADQELTYVFGLSDGSCIDGAVQGNATAHLNHSCVSAPA